MLRVGNGLHQLRLGLRLARQFPNSLVGCVDFNLGAFSNFPLTFSCRGQPGSGAKQSKLRKQVGTQWPFRLLVFRSLRKPCAPCFSTRAIQAGQEQTPPAGLPGWWVSAPDGELSPWALAQAWALLRVSGKCGLDLSDGQIAEALPKAGGGPPTKQSIRNWIKSAAIGFTCGTSPLRLPNAGQGKRIKSAAIGFRCGTSPLRRSNA